MNHKELMIGNHVLIDNTTSAVVEQIKYKYCSVRYLLDGNERVSQVEHERLFPVPLTEEWLMRAGFVKRRRNLYKKGIVSILFITDDLGVTQFRASIEQGIYGYTTIKIEYVHQLQNLFFA